MVAEGDQSCEKGEVRKTERRKMDVVGCVRRVSGEVSLLA